MKAVKSKPPSGVWWRSSCAETDSTRRRKRKDFQEPRHFCNSLILVNIQTIPQQQAQNPAVKHFNRNDIVSAHKSKQVDGIPAKKFKTRNNLIQKLADTSMWQVQIAFCICYLFRLLSAENAVSV